MFACCLGCLALGGGVYFFPKETRGAIGAPLGNDAERRCTTCDGLRYKGSNMGFFDRISQGLQRSRDKFKEEMNVLLDRGPDLDEEFWDGLEETLILADIGGAGHC